MDHLLSREKRAGMFLISFECKGTQERTLKTEQQERKKLLKQR